MKRVIDAGASNPQWDEVINKAIDKTEFAEVTTPGADVEFSIEHGFGVVPVGFIVIGSDRAAVVYNSVTTWNVERIFLKCNVAGAAIRILIF